MISVNEATRIITESVKVLPTVKVPLEKALGRVLREPIIADMDFPPFDRIMMDGIAVRFADFEKGIRKYKIRGIQAAGAPQQVLEDSDGCLEVMTGAIRPLGTDAVIPYEEVEIDELNRTAKISDLHLELGKNIHKKGTDKKQGDVLISDGTVIRAPEIALAASVGMTKILVSKNPKVAVISTGDELVDIDEKPAPHQIRRSNVYAVAAELKHFGIKADMFHFDDDKKALAKEMKKALNDHDVLLLSGGVSMGKFDFIPQVLEELGVEKKFHRIKQKPGKPFWFGVKNDDKFVFAFPGNPVSTFLCFHKYLIPWLKTSLAVSQQPFIKAMLADDVKMKTSLTYFLQVNTATNEEGVLKAYPRMGKGSGDHANLSISDAFLELPASNTGFKKGQVFDLIPFR